MIRTSGANRAIPDRGPGSWLAGWRLHPCTSKTLMTGPGVAHGRERRKVIRHNTNSLDKRTYKAKGSLLGGGATRGEQALNPVVGGFAT